MVIKTKEKPLAYTNQKININARKQNLWGKMKNKMKPKKTTDDKIILAQMIFTAIIIALLFGLEHTLENLYIIIAVMVIGFFVQIVIHESPSIIHESPSIFKKKNNDKKNEKVRNKNLC